MRNKKLKTLNSEQLVSKQLLQGLYILMAACSILRLFGFDFLGADTSSINEPSEIVCDIINASLFVIETSICFSILTKKRFLFCIIIAILELFVNFIPIKTVRSIIYMLAYFIIPLVITKDWKSLIRSALLYALCTLYGFLYLYGRIGISTPETEEYGIISIIDYKVFFIALLIFIKNYGGSKYENPNGKIIWQHKEKCVSD